MANRFAASKKERMVLRVVSDYDPEGLATLRIHSGVFGAHEMSMLR